MQAGKYSYLYKWVSIGIILIGVSLRLWQYAGDRGLWTDEIAVALNIAERSFAELTQPLSYKQYAPPLFLWLVKLCSLIFGAGEYSLRLVLFLSGIAVLIVFYRVLKQFVSIEAGWYPLLMLATGVFYIRYSAELKQYMPDALVALTLVWLAKKWDIKTLMVSKFTLSWLLLGSISIWASMPSVFVLAGVGCYYLIQVLKQRDNKKLFMLIGIAVTWLIQFALYYFLILKREVQSEYLVGYHERYFLSDNWTGNKEIVKAILNEAFNTDGWMLKINLALMLLGSSVLIYKRRDAAVLILLPVTLLFCAAYLKQYSLIPRLALFAMPLLLLLAGVAIDVFIRNRIAVRIAIPALIVIFVVSKPFAGLNKPWHEERMKEALAFVRAEEINSSELFVYTGAVESFRYYTEVHPDKEKWSQISKAYLLNADVDIDSVLRHLPNRSAVLYTIPFDNYDTRAKFEQHAVLEKYFEDEGCSVFVFKRKAEAR